MTYLTNCVNSDCESITYNVRQMGVAKPTKIVYIERFHKLTNTLYYAHHNFCNQV